MTALYGASLRSHERLKNLALVLPMTGISDPCAACHGATGFRQQDGQPADSRGPHLPECKCGEPIRTRVTPNVSCWAVAEGAGDLSLPRPPSGACGGMVLRKRAQLHRSPTILHLHTVTTLAALSHFRWQMIAAEHVRNYRLPVISTASMHNAADSPCLQK